MNKDRKSLYQIVMPGLMGNVLEWYDFALYGYFAVIISPLFFPAETASVSYLANYTVFAVGFLMRPLGAILFGHFGDKYGRKNALSAAIILMAIPTTIIGCLPGYKVLGIMAPVLLTFCRLLQGLAVGGEFTGSIVYIVEHSPKEKRGLYGSLTMASAFIGLIIGSFAALIVHKYFDDVDFAWRIPFLLSIFLGCIGLYLRLGMPESPVFKTYLSKQQKNHKPLKKVIEQHLKSILIAITLVLLPSTGFYMSFVYLPTYLKTYLSIEMEQAMLANTVCMLAIVFILPICGYFSDKFSRYKILLIGCGGFFLLSIPLYLLLMSKIILYVYICLFTFALLVALSYATIPVVLVEMFPVDVRFTGMSLPYNLANALFGGTAPLVATQLITLTDNLLMPAIYLVVLSVISYFGLRQFWKNKNLINF